MNVAQERETVTTLLNDVTQLRQIAETLPRDDQRVSTLETVVSHRLADAPAIRATIAATILGISEPTVRAWADRGVLAIRSRTPRLLLEPASVFEVRELVEDLRRAGTSANLLDELYNQLADERLRADPDLAESLEQMRHGQYSVRRPRSA